MVRMYAPGLAEICVMVIIIIIAVISPTNVSTQRFSRSRKMDIISEK